jgi:hypothetical protein
MQSLLRWSIENSRNSNDTASGAAPPSRRTDLDPGIIDAILGRPDSELMKEALAKAQDASLDEDARLTALDDLEMVMSLFREPPFLLQTPGLRSTGFLYIYVHFQRLTLFLVRLRPPAFVPHCSSLRTSTTRMVMQQHSVLFCPTRVSDSAKDPDLWQSLVLDLEKLGMWEPLQSLLASPSDDVKVQALWVIGTAMQNNPAAQKAVRPSPLSPLRARAPTPTDSSWTENR